MAGNLANARGLQKDDHYEPVVRETAVANSISIAEMYSDLGRISTPQQQSSDATRMRAAGSVRFDNHPNVTLTFFGLFHKPWAYKWGRVLLIEAVICGLLYGLSHSLDISLLNRRSAEVTAYV